MAALGSLDRDDLRNVQTHFLPFAAVTGWAEVASRLRSRARVRVGMASTDGWRSFLLLFSWLQAGLQDVLLSMQGWALRLRPLGIRLILLGRDPCQSIDHNQAVPTVNHCVVCHRASLSQDLSHVDRARSVNFFEY